MTDINTLEDNVVKICRDLIKIDTTNFGNNESVGEDKAAEYVSAFLNKLQIENKIVGPDNKRRSVLARIEGSHNESPDLVLHGHLDVVPVEKDKWTKEAFAAVVDGDLLWGRGAVDMKNGNAMILGSIAQLISEGWKPKRNITIAMFADEEAGGKYGSHFAVNNYGEYFENASEAVGEVGGF
jgi:acetylornithine deacetylase/succinyl-diaminopimelate desuccinylase-like protein